jgi:competence protein ComEC
MLTQVFIWKKAPFVRFLLPLIVGIILQWYFQLHVQILWYAFVIFIPGIFLSFFFSGFGHYKLSFINGIAVTIIFLALGSLLAWYKDIRHNPAWYGNCRGYDLVVATLQESLVEKTNSYKASATVTALKVGGRFISAKGNLVLYFKKEPAENAASTLSLLSYGSQLIFSNQLQEIKNAGNPGGFDYRRYSLFQDITHQVFLKQDEFIVLHKKKQPLLGKILFVTREKILSILRKYIHEEKEKGLAEALLIGYRDDLDKNLVQSYTNTGVVHIIAISGMHIALIYWVLAFLCRPFKKIKYSKWFTAIVIIAGLWLFSLAAGGQPSVLRSAVMFTCIVLAENFSRKTSIYNTLAFSAFVLLCINPYWIWDVGFQLSYAAVLSIVIFMKPVYNWFYIKNKSLDSIWKLNAVSIAAQLLTTPFSLYHFHQFPDFFLLTNLVAVPLSGIIVLGEILLCTLSFFPFMAILSGKILSLLIRLMNSYIERIELLPYSLWEGIQINILQAALLIVIVAGFGYWLLEKQKAGVWIGILSALVFVLLRSFSFCQSHHQRKLIVYNIPKHRAIDIIDGRNYFFIGDSDLAGDDFARNFYMKPSRILLRARPAYQLADLLTEENFLQYGSKRILLIDKNIIFDTAVEKIPIDLLLVSKSPRLYLSKLAKTFNIKQIVFDGSVSSRKLKYWIKDCDSLHVPHYNIMEKGAFVMSLN